ncbi:MAG: hypothetical protein HY071_00130 [Chloroflexi bacterium]|nr:hypothetical protein [Chloroflexota bacterium]
MTGPLSLLLVAVGYGFLLPPIAIIHVRNTAVRQSGAILGTIAGAATATVGISASVNANAAPASLFAMGVWWWTIGKMSAQTGVLPRAFGYATAAAGAAAFALAALAPFQPGVAGADHTLLGLWLLALAVVLLRS